ncbi:putative glucose transporter rco-3 [Venturia nashicola]|uniref:Putative glucose transporter rco-3 n=1 Tax=Venturia nashicola TaxID=86259 RepID=A0A4Z1PEG5_9PEZI|nr:putative glucose transporter rco-3 [Venturia nashicola]
MAPATGASENEAFLVACITNVKDGSGMIKPDWEKIGALLGMKPHTAYCRWNKIMKTVNISNGGSASGSADAINATFGGSGGTPKGKGTPKVTPKKSPSKRKQAFASDDEDKEEFATPQAKKATGGKKGVVKEEKSEEKYFTADSGKGDDEAYMGV